MKRSTSPFKKSRSTERAPILPFFTKFISVVSNAQPKRGIRASPKTLAAICAAVTGITVISAASCQLAGPKAEISQENTVFPAGAAKPGTQAPAVAATDAPAGKSAETPASAPEGWNALNQDIVYTSAFAPGAQEPLFEAALDGCKTEPLAPSALEFKSPPGPESPASAEIQTSDPKNPATLKFVLRSPFAIHRLVARITTTPAGDLMTVAVDGARATFSASPGDRAALRSAACGSLAAAEAAGNIPPKFQPSAKIIDLVRDAARFTAPDCEITIDLKQGGFICTLPVADAEMARQELVGIRSAMIRGWSRQPYLITRRLAIGINLAEAITHPQFEKKLDTFCKVARASLTAELPATLSSRRWQTAACSGAAASRKKVAQFGLAKTVAEIDFLRQLFERTSKLGLLSVRIPSLPGNASRLLVSLAPESDVVDNLTRETQKLLASEGGQTAKSSSDDVPRVCWHPVYGEDHVLLELARNLAMAGEVTHVACGSEPPLPPRAAQQVARYFAESIAGETEFVLPNGRSKTLRLPIGSYRYVLRALPEQAEDWDDTMQSAPSTKGHITWDDKRPRPAVTAW